MKQYSTYEFGDLHVLVKRGGDTYDLRTNDFQIAVLYRGKLLSTSYAHEILFGRKEATEHIKVHKKDILSQIRNIDGEVMR